jgi:hypothetical protein
VASSDSYLDSSSSLSSTCWLANRFTSCSL